MPGANPRAGAGRRAAPNRSARTAWPRLFRQIGRHPHTLLAALLLLWLSGVLAWLLAMASAAALPGQWHAGPDGGLWLDPAASRQPPALAALAGQRLLTIGPTDGGPPWPATGRALPASPRWAAHAAERRDHLAAQQQLAALLARPTLRLTFDSGQQVLLAPAPRGLAGLGLGTALLAAAAWGLGLCAALLLAAYPGRWAACYLVLACAHAGVLLTHAAAVLPQPGAAPAAWLAGWWLEPLLEALACAALLGLLAGRAGMGPVARPDRPAQLLGWAVWWVAAAAGGIASMGALEATGLPTAWWPAALPWLACLVVGLGWVLATPRVHASTSTTTTTTGPNGTASRTTTPTTATVAGAAPARPGRRRTGPWLLLTGLVALAVWWAWLATRPGAGTPPLHRLASQGAAAWALLVAGLLVVAAWPRLASGHRPLLVWLAGAGGVCAAAWLAVDHLWPQPSGPAALWMFWLAAALCLGLLRWQGRRTATAQSREPTAERLFDHLYRSARALQLEPERSHHHMAQLLRNVFDPLEVSLAARTVSRVRGSADGLTLAVPAPDLGADGDPQARRGTLVLRHARRGHRRFTEDDGRLAEQLLDQLRQAVAYDRAVERGRTEERTRIAQDLHDDIGARLLTLMYKAPNAEIEEYLRHTLQDLKTLTRGLAAASPRLSHAAVEWRADLTQRLHAAGCDLRWSCTLEHDIHLNTVQWSGLTRVLRELVNNIIAHAGAGQVDIALQFDGRRLRLSVQDDGHGRAPDTWSHGLGLGGVRKRVKLMGGDVGWHELAPRGIRSEVQVPLRTEDQG